MRALAIACAMAATLAVHLGDVRAEGVYERDAVDIDAPEGVTITQVVVDNRLGDVSVRGHNRPGIAIQSFKRALDNETLERLVVSLVPNAQGRVHIRTTLRAGEEPRPIPAGSVAVDLVIFVPHAAMVEAELWKGNLRVSGVDNGAKLLVDKGRIEVKQVSGSVVSDLRRGDQEFAELIGELEASGIEGLLAFDSIRGKRLHAKTVRGRIEGRGIVVDAMVATSVFGDIELALEPKLGGDYRVASRKGDVEVQFHGATPVALMVSAKNAMIGPELGASRADASSPWRGHFGARPDLESQVRPAHLQIRADGGRVVVKHF